MIEELRRQQIEEIQKRRLNDKRRRRKFFLIIPAVLLLIQIYSDTHFQITYYELESEKTEAPVKIVVLSDLHSVEYGQGNQKLIEAVKTEEPDFIAMLGDMVNKDDTDFSVIRHLCRELKEIAPVYYTLGNHEGSLMFGRLDSVELDKFLEEEGVKVLINQVAEFKKDDTTICLAGTSNGAQDYDQWAREKLEDFWSMEGYKIVLSHFPDLYYDKLKDKDFDLALAGHYHGGIIRIPGVGGLYHPEEGLFPRYSGGRYLLTHGVLIVSRGIGGHGFIPRINNRPELVVIEIK